MRFGVIGWGLRKSIAQQAHDPEKGRELVALADPCTDACQSFRDFIGKEVACTAEYRDLLTMELDAIFILSPDHLHEEHAISCLEAGVPAYLEKPMAITTEGCDRILEAARHTGTKLYLGHNMRHFPVVRKMKEWIDAGMIGEVQAAWCRHFVSYGGEAYFQDWHADRRNTTSLLLQKGAHDIDVLHWLCGSYTRRVSAIGKLGVYGAIQDRYAPGERHKIAFKSTWPPETLSPLNSTVDVEDVSMMLMELENGVLASYQQCHFAPDAWRNYTIIGSKGRIENFGDSPGNAVIRLWESASWGYREQGDLEYRPPVIKGGHGGADSLIMDEFLRYVREGGETDTSPLAARMAVAAGVAATHSLRNGAQPVEVPGVGALLEA